MPGLPSGCWLGGAVTGQATTPWAGAAGLVAGGWVLSAVGVATATAVAVAVAVGVASGCGVRVSFFPLNSR